MEVIEKDRMSMNWNDWQRGWVKREREREGELVGGREKW